MSFEFSEIAASDADAAYSDTPAKIEVLEREARLISAYLKTIKPVVEVGKEDYEAHNFDEDPYILSNIIAVNENMYHLVRTHVLTMSKALAVYPKFILNIEQDKQNDYHSQEYAASSPVHVCLEDDAIMVQMPLLWTRQNNRAKFKNDHRISPSRLDIYSAELFNVIRFADNFKSYDFLKFNERIFHFCYIYNTRDLKTTLTIPDNDNYEIKYIIDAISSYLRAGDSPLVTSIFSSSRLSKDVPTGTYIAVTNEEDGIKNACDIIDFWKNKSSETH